MVLLDGKALSDKIKDSLALEVEKLTSAGIRPPHLSAILVGEDRASQSYVRGKMKSCERIGFESSLFTYNTDVSEEELLEKIEELNTDDEIDGFIVQLPLPSHISENKVIEAISPEKDVDGFHPINIGRMAKNLDALLPATPSGILEILKAYQLETSGKHCVVIGRSNIVGMPMSILMGRKNYPGDCTVTLVHSRTKNVKEICQTADILIAAIGKAYYVTKDMVKQGAIVIDVGINDVDDPGSIKGYKLVGDVDFEQVASKCSYITPVPGGVGAMTIASLLQNTLIAAQKRRM